MDELIERLRSFVVERGKIARGSDIVTACNNSALSLSDLRTLLAALEAAREDAERYRWLREHDDRNLWEFKGAYHDIAELKRGKDLDTAIDQARGKGVA